MTEVKVPGADKNVGGRPRKKLDTNAPEFKAAVAEQVAAMRSAIVAELLPSLTEQMASARATAGTLDAPAVSGDASLMRELALHIAELNDQGSGRKRVAPDVLQKREEHRADMLAKIMAAKAKGEQPWYVLITKTYLNEILLEPFQTDPKTKEVRPTEIMWEGIPNEAMRPHPESRIANEIFEQFLGWIGGITGATTRGKNGRGMDADLRDVGVTPNGMVVRGMSQAQKRTMGNLADSNNGRAQDVAVPGQAAPAPLYGEGLKVHSPNDPRAREVRVLGSVHPAAQQNTYAGEQH